MAVIINNIEKWQKTCLILFNSEGIEINRYDIKQGKNQIQINLSVFTSGIYYLKFKTESYEQIEKLIIVK